MNGTMLGWLSWVAANLPYLLTALLSGVTAAYSAWTHKVLTGAYSPTGGTSAGPAVQPAPAALTPILPIGTGSPPPAPVPVVAGGGNSSAGLPLGVLPAWSEQRVKADDGSPADGHNGLCGEVCCAAIIAAVHGVPTDPIDHRIHVHGYGGSALTNAQDLTSILQYCSVGASPRLVAWEDAHLLMVARLGEGCYTILLVAPDWVQGALHWVVPVHLEGVAVLVFDPWDGVLRPVSIAQLGLWYSGQMVTTSARAHYDCRGWAMPPS